MNFKIIKKMANLSYTNNLLDGKKVDKIVKQLSQKDLKMYIKSLKNIENKNTVTIVVPNLLKNSTLLNEVKKLFANKKIILKEDRSLIAGLQLIDNDTIYDFNLKNNIKQMVNYINK